MSSAMELVGPEITDLVIPPRPTIGQQIEEAKKVPDTMSEEARLLRDAAKGTGRVTDPYAKIPGVDKVAIVGFANTTRQLAPYGDASWEIWSLNEGYHFGFLWRWDRWFQIHPRWNFARRYNRNHENHLQWLQAQPAPGEPDGFPIYMHQHYEDIPASVQYPLKEICEKFRTNWLSSSIAEMLAMAMYLDIRTVAFYGVEMGSETEYKYQRENFSYWKGMADGLGFEIILPEVTNICRGPIYGFEMIPNLHVDNLKPLVKLGDRKEKEHAVKYAGTRGAIQELIKLKRMGVAVPDAEFVRLLEEERKRKKMANVAGGTHHEFLSYLEHIEEQYPNTGEGNDPNALPSVGRQELEFRQKALKIGKEDQLKILGSHTGKLDMLLNLYENKMQLPQDRDGWLKLIEQERQAAEKTESVLQQIDGSAIANDVLVNLIDMHYQRGVRIARYEDELKELQAALEKAGQDGTEKSEGQNPPDGGKTKELPQQQSPA